METLLSMGCVNKRIHEFVKKERDTLTIEIFRNHFGSFMKILESSKIDLCKGELNFVIFFELLTNLKVLSFLKKKYKYQKYLKSTHNGTVFIFKNYDLVSESMTLLILIKLIEYIEIEYPDHKQYLKPWILYLCFDYIALNIIDRKEQTSFLNSDLRHDIKNRVLSIKYEIRKHRFHRGMKERLQQVVSYLERNLNNAN